MLKQKRIPSYFLFFSLFLAFLFILSSFQSQSIFSNEVTIIAYQDTIPDQPRMEVDIKANENEHTLDSVDELPRFPGCENKSSAEEKKNCADLELLKYIYGRIKYPSKARDKGTDGMVIIEFYVDIDGSIVEPVIKKDIGDGCGEEALRVVKTMCKMQKKWTPGKLNGIPLKTKYTLPVKFRLH